MVLVEGKEEDVLPKPDWKPPPTIPKEHKTGTNKKTFFVCNERKYLNITLLLTDHYHSHW